MMKHLLDPLGCGCIVLPRVVLSKLVLPRLMQPMLMQPKLVIAVLIASEPVGRMQPILIPRASASELVQAIPPNIRVRVLFFSHLLACSRGHAMFFMLWHIWANAR